MPGYATTLPLPAADPADVLHAAARWIRRRVGTVPANLIGPDVQTGRARHTGPAGDVVLVDVAVVPDRGLLVDVEWTHPGVLAHQEYRTLVTVAALPDVTVAVRGEVRDTRMRLAPVDADYGPPRLVRDLLADHPLIDAGLQVRPDPHLVGVDAARRLADSLLDPQRTLPVIHLSYNREAGRPLVDPRQLAHALTGIAHVTYSQYGLPDVTLRGRLGRLGTWGGAVRTYWPGMADDDEPWRHPLFTARALADWRGRPLHAQLVADLRRVALESPLSNPPAWRDIRRAVRVAELAGPTAGTVDVDQLRGRVHDLAVELQRAEAERAEWEAFAQACEAARERADQDRQAAEARERTAQANLRAVLTVGTSPTAHDADDDHDVDGPATPDPTSTADAVAMAGDAAGGLLRFLPSAVRSAAGNPYRRPVEILDALMAIAAVVTEMRTDGGLGCHPGERGRQLGLDWTHTKPSRKGGTRRALYEFTDPDRGVVRLADDRVRLGGGSGAGLCARIYFTIDTDTPDGPQAVICHVGEHLPDSTTG